MLGMAGMIRRCEWLFPKSNQDRVSPKGPSVKSNGMRIIVLCYGDGIDSAEWVRVGRLMSPVLVQPQTQQTPVLSVFPLLMPVGGVTNAIRQSPSRLNLA
jgi:hypothetical protein